MINKKLRIGWFSFSCCEDSTIIFTELLNENYKEWMKKIEFCSALVMKKKSEIRNLDVAFVEGAITSSRQEEKLKEIRGNSKKLVAIGACACVGMPSSQRNLFDKNQEDEIAPVLAQFHYSQKVKKIADVVTIDGQVPGCPMDEKTFLAILNQALVEFGIS